MLTWSQWGASRRARLGVLSVLFACGGPAGGDTEPLTVGVPVLDSETLGLEGLEALVAGPQVASDSFTMRTGPNRYRLACEAWYGSWEKRVLFSWGGRGAQRTCNSQDASQRLAFELPANRRVSIRVWSRRAQTNEWAPQVLLLPRSTGVASFGGDDRTLPASEGANVKITCLDCTGEPQGDVPPTPNPAFVRTVFFGQKGRKVTCQMECRFDHTGAFGLEHELRLYERRQVRRGETSYERVASCRSWVGAEHRFNLTIDSDEVVVAHYHKSFRPDDPSAALSAFYQTSEVGRPIRHPQDSSSVRLVMSRACEGMRRDRE